MMTDIEGSTALVHQLGDEYGKLIREVRRIIRKIVAGHDGHVVDVRADESFAVFKRPHEPPSSQRIAIQLDLGQRPATRKHDVSFGSASTADRPTVSDGNYIGIAVHTTARICSAAHGGQIVVSGQTKDAIKDQTPRGHQVSESGKPPIRGLPDQLTLYQIEAEGLDTNFPPLTIGD